MEGNHREKTGNREVLQLKRAQLETVAGHRSRLRTMPHLRWLFFEITNCCNLSCRHCGSNYVSDGVQLKTEDVARTLDAVRSERPVICLTGGEPMLHPDLYQIAECVRERGALWGMTTNATLIDDTAAARLRETGLTTVSVSLDGLER